jgi:Arc/MetJ-type ribon-helix-helix transcriptional regulator
MPNITLSLPEDIYRKMKSYSEIRWSEVIRKAIAEYLEKLEEIETEVSSKELLEELGEDFRNSLKELDFDKVLKVTRK